MDNRLIKVVFGLAACIGITNADLVTVKYVSPADGSIEYIRENGGSAFGVYTGLYNITVNGAAATTFCIDPQGTIYPNDIWTANVLQGNEIIGSGMLYSSAYSSSAAIATEKYAMISYLANLSFYATPADPRLDSKDERSDLSLMYWEIASDYTGTLESMNFSSGSFAANSTVATNLLAEAYNHRSDNIDIAIYAPTARRSQEFLAVKNVPEPGSLGMLLLGLTGLFGFSLKRKKN